jgi:hypothetical protein
VLRDEVRANTRRKTPSFANRKHLGGASGCEACYRAARNPGPEPGTGCPEYPDGSDTAFPAPCKCYAPQRVGGQFYIFESFSRRTLTGFWRIFTAAAISALALALLLHAYIPSIRDATATSASLVWPRTLLKER